MFSRGLKQMEVYGLKGTAKQLEPEMAPKRT